MPNIFQQFARASNRREWIALYLARKLGVDLSTPPQAAAETAPDSHPREEAAHPSILALQERALLATGQIAARQVRALDRLGCLSDAESRIYSQWGEDGILEWLISRLPELPTTFVEFGVEDYIESNTRFLARHRGWRGLVMDGSKENVARIRADPIHVLHDVTAIAAFVTAENVNALLADHGPTGEIGLLSVDIDGNDYWVLEAIESVSPGLLVVEYNAILGDRHDVAIPYDPGFTRFGGHPSGQYYGASLRAFQRLATTRGYHFLGTNSAGVNAFFVRDDLAAPVLRGLESIRAWPSRHRDARDADFRMTFARGMARSDLIADMPVIDFTTGATRTVAELGPLYGPDWLAQMEGAGAAPLSEMPVAATHAAPPEPFVTTSDFVMARSAGGGHWATHQADAVIGRSIRQTGHFQEDAIDTVLHLLETAGCPVARDVFVDIGANIGTHSVHAAQLGFAHVAAFEPDPTNFLLLRVNTLLHGVEDAVACHRLAVSDAGGTMQMEISPANFGDHRLRVAAAQQSAAIHDEGSWKLQDVPVRTFDDLMLEGRIPVAKPSLVWIDTQGHEGHVLSSASQLRAARCPVVLEFWPYGLERSGGYSQLREALAAFEGTRILDLGAMTAALSKSGETALADLDLTELDHMYETLRAGKSKAGSPHTDLLLLPD